MADTYSFWRASTSISRSQSAICCAGSVFYPPLLESCSVQQFGEMLAATGLFLARGQNAERLVDVHCVSENWLTSVGGGEASQCTCKLVLLCVIGAVSSVFLGTLWGKNPVTGSFMPLEQNIFWVGRRRSLGSKT